MSVRVSRYDRAARTAFLWATRTQRRVRFLSHLPTKQYDLLRTRPPIGPWPRWELAPPADLADCPGIRRQPEEEQTPADKKPLHVVGAIHREVYQEIWLSLGPVVLPMLPKLLRAARNARADGSAFESASSGDAFEPSAVPVASTSTDLSKEVKEKAASLGLSAVGFAAFDPKYRYAESPPPIAGADTRIIVCILEQRYDTLQRAPHRLAERSVFHAYSEVLDRAADLAAFLRSRGFRTRVQSPAGLDVAIQYAVASGLGQLGLNGQLLTPYAGSRCRLLLVETDAPLELDSPVDYGIREICNRCQVCVKRCPSGAIPKERSYHRGVEKSKITLKRCLPVVLQAEGCAVCMKVCPVQRFGLERVYAEFEESGKILGKDTDDLESYHWPVDGRTYGKDEKPRLGTEFFDVPTFHPERTEPVPPDPGWKPVVYVSPYKGL